MRRYLPDLLNSASRAAPVALGIALCLGVVAATAFIAGRPAPARREEPRPRNPLLTLLSLAWRPLVATLVVEGLGLLSARRLSADPAPPGFWGAIRNFRPWRDNRSRGVTIH